jgi:hypothetical protein
MFLSVELTKPNIKTENPIMTYPNPSIPYHT